MRTYEIMCTVLTTITWFTNQIGLKWMSVCACAHTNIIQRPVQACSMWTTICNEIKAPICWMARISDFMQIPAAEMFLNDEMTIFQDDSDAETAAKTILLRPQLQTFTSNRMFDGYICSHTHIVSWLLCALKMYKCSRTWSSLLFCVEKLFAVPSLCAWMCQFAIFRYLCDSSSAVADFLSNSSARLMFCISPFTLQNTLQNE